MITIFKISVFIDFSSLYKWSDFFQSEASWIYRINRELCRNRIDWNMRIIFIIFANSVSCLHNTNKILGKSTPWKFLFIPNPTWSFCLPNQWGFGVCKIWKLVDILAAYYIGLPYFSGIIGLSVIALVRAACTYNNLACAPVWWGKNHWITQTCWIVPGRSGPSMKGTNN